MRKPKLYIETSAWNFYFADDAPEKRDATQVFFELVFKKNYDVFISEVVIKEVFAAPEKRRSEISELISRCEPVELHVSQDVRDLADRYIEKKIVPEKKYEDSLHVAVASVEELDAVVTWNFRHMANLRRAELFHSVNVECGYYKKLELVTPLEVMYDED